MSSRLCKILQICEDSDRLNDEDASMLMYHIAREMNASDRKKAITQIMLGMKTQVSNQSLDEILVFKQGKKLVRESNNEEQKQQEQEDCAETKKEKDQEMKQNVNQTSAADGETSFVEVKDSDTTDTVAEKSQVLVGVNRLTFVPCAIFQHIAKFLLKKQWLRLSLCNHQSYYMIHNQSFFKQNMQYVYWHQCLKVDSYSRGIWELNADDIPDIIKNPSNYKHRESGTKTLYLRPGEFLKHHCTNSDKKCNLSKLFDACEKDEKLKWLLKMLSKIESLKISCRWICAYQHIPFKWLLLRDPSIDENIEYPYPLKMISVADRGINPSQLNNLGVDEVCQQFDQYYQTYAQKQRQDADVDDEHIKSSFKIRPINEIYYPFYEVYYKIKQGQINQVQNCSTTDALLESKLPQHVNTAYLFVSENYWNYQHYRAALRFASPQQFAHFFHPKTDTLVLRIANFKQNQRDYYYGYKDRKYPFAKYFFKNEKLIQYFHQRSKSAAIDDEDEDEDEDQTGDAQNNNQSNDQKSQAEKKELTKDEQDDAEAIAIAKEMENIKQWLNIKKLEVRCDGSTKMIFFTHFIDDPDHDKLWNYFNFANTIEKLELKLTSTADIKQPLTSLIFALNVLADLKILFVFADQLLGYQSSKPEQVRKMVPFFENDFGDVLKNYLLGNDQVESQMIRTGKTRTLTVQWRNGQWWSQQYYCTFIIYEDESDNQDTIYDGFKGKHVTIDQATHESALIASSRKYQDIDFEHGCQKCIRYQKAS